MEIDIKNKKILTELIINSRIPINQLAKKVGISREVATYRINKLIQEKIILDFYTIIDIQKLGFSKAGCLIQFKGISKEKEKEFLDYLVEHEFVTYLGPLTGKWNLAFDIVYKDKEQLSSIIKELENKFTRFLDKILVISSGFEEESFPTKIFDSKKKFEIKETKEINLDKTDLKILKEISINSRIEYKELADKIKLSANAIKYRIKNLEKSGIILGYTLSVDFRKLQYEMYNLQIKKT
ncbi:MAG: winged helix-turn-helix transcriptional regulator, partial [Nanoarchaeota archaeon]